MAPLYGCDKTPAECSDSSMITMFRDEDFDTHGDSATQTLRCEFGPGWVSTGNDCDDERSNVSPTGIEECDGLDNDCDGETDEGLRVINFYRDADEDGYGNPEDIDQACAPPEGFVENPFDCDDTDPLTYPQAGEFCDEKDNDCDGAVDDADNFVDPDSMPFWYFDGDNDGYGTPDLFQQRCTQPPNTVSNDEDCDDNDASRNPLATEICNRVDDDCDGWIDDSDDNLDTSGQDIYYYDADGDGHGDADNTFVACFPPWFYVTIGDDCDDDEPVIQDASTGWWVFDGDGDGYGTGLRDGPFCDPPDVDWVLEDLGDDCDDANVDVNPGELEVCDGIDNDCDNAVDDADPDLDITTQSDWYADIDSDLYGDPADMVSACIAPPNYVTDDTDCDDTNGAINPGATEICNADIDDNCNGLADAADPTNDPASELTWYQDFDGDGFGNGAISITSCSQPSGYVANGDDCNDNYPEILGNVDWLADTDSDGYGAGPILGPACSAPQPNAVPAANGTDCDDGDPLTYPGAVEVCGDGLDQDCDLVDMVCFPDTCAEAMAYPAIATGNHNYADDLTLYIDDISFTGGNNCTGNPTDGGDAIVPVILEAGEAVTVNYRNDGDASAYLVLDCNAPGPNDCYLAGDNNIAQAIGGAEDMVFLNTTAVQVAGYIVLDCNGACSGFDLSIDIGIPAPFLPSGCADASAWPDYSTGGLAMFGTLDGMAGNISLSNGNVCTGNTTVGVDSILPIDLLDGETIDVSYTQIQGDASVYLLEDCADPLGTCLTASDAGADGVEESITYTNSTGGNQNLRLVLDCYDGQFCGDFAMTMAIY